MHSVGAYFASTRAGSVARHRRDALRRSCLRTEVQAQSMLPCRSVAEAEYHWRHWAQAAVRLAVDLRRVRSRRSTVITPVAPFTW